MKIEKKIEVNFDEEEIKALRTIAHIDCYGIDCHRHGCPFDRMLQGETTCCIKGEIKEMMIEKGISF